MSEQDFWDGMSEAFVVESAIDQHLRGKTLDGHQNRSMQDLTDKYRAANALRLPVDAGTRVSFIANLGSVLSYSDIPGDGMEGTVVTVKTGAGHTTSLDERVFVQWDDGKFRPILAEHLRPAKSSAKQAANVRMVVSDLGDLSGFFMAGAREDELIHKSTQDLWAFKQDGEQYVIERLFDDTGTPLKV